MLLEQAEPTYSPSREAAPCQQPPVPGMKVTSAAVLTHQQMSVSAVIEQADGLRATWFSRVLQQGSKACG